MRKQLKEVVKCVTEELRTNYSARTNDNELILGVMKRLGVDTNIPFSELIHSGNLPTSFESITRARRKVQAQNPMLKDKPTADLRQEQEEVYRKFAKENL